MSHFVFSSVERGGEIDDKDAILDRLVKIHIENHVKSLGEKGLKWTQVDSCLFKLLELTSVTRTEFYDRASSWRTLKGLLVRLPLPSSNVA